MTEMFLEQGTPAPWFRAASGNIPNYNFSAIAGRYIVLCFFESAGEMISQRILRNFVQESAIFDDEKCCFFGVSTDLADQQLPRVQERIPGIRFFWDFDRAISRQYQVLNPQGTYHKCTYLLDERLRILDVLPFADRPETHVARLVEKIASLPALPQGSATVQAPVLVVPRIFEPELCQELIAYYNHHGGIDSGFMREVGGKTVVVSDHSFKRRQDQEILDQDLRDRAMYRLHSCLVPEIQKAFQFNVTRIERHIVACYDSTLGGFFNPHRDNTTKGTAHRRFAVSLNLNTGEYEGGLLRFPEFGQQTYVAPAGGAVVFSCSLLHEATPVTSGVRYAYLPFLYDEEAAKIRQMNQRFVELSMGARDDVKEPPANRKQKGFQGASAPRGKKSRAQRS